MPKYRLHNGRLQRTLSVTLLEDRTTPTLCCGDFLTYTQGGWGAVPNGGNPGTYLHANFVSAFVTNNSQGGLQIGSQTLGAASDGIITAGNQAHLFTTAQALTDWLPQGGGNAALGGDAVNPNDPQGGAPDTLAGQTAALALNLGFDDYDPAFSPSTTDLGNLILTGTGGPFDGQTVQFVLNTCNAILSGLTVPGISASQANDAADKINRNFDNGSVNGGTDLGYLDCSDDDCDGNILVDVTILGRKFNDLNGNGNDDGGTDPGIPDWEVSIWLDSDGDGAVDGGETTVVTTADDGTFEFTGSVPTAVLTAGAMYTVDEVQQSGWTQTFGNAGYDGTLTLTNPTAEGNDFGNFKNVTIRGEKFYDANTDGVRGGGEPAIAGWQVGIDVNGDNVADYFTLTGADGSYVFGDLDNADMDDDPLTGSDLGPNATFTIIESTQANWVATTPTSINFTVGGSGVQSGGESTGNDFGNVKLGATGGKTLGFWSNKNGEAIFKGTDGGASALAGLQAQNLRNANGNQFDPADYKAFRTWLLNATATNMSYMLSAQYAAAWLNVNKLGVDDDTMIHVGTLSLWAGNVQGAALVTNLGTLVSPTGFVRLGDVMAAANTLLGTNGSILAGDPLRPYAEALKVVLDGFNNNLTISVAGLTGWNDDGDGIMESGEFGTWAW